jgi:hypothetical protein
MKISASQEGCMQNNGHFITSHCGLDYEGNCSDVSKENEKFYCTISIPV